MLSRKYRALSSLAILLCASSSYALACSGETVLFEDDFTESDNGNWLIWPTDQTYIKAEKGHLSFRPPSNSGRTSGVVTALFPADVDICATGMIMTSTGKPSDIQMSIDFWANGLSDYYNFGVNGEGMGNLSRWNGKSWNTIYPQQKMQGFRIGVGEENTLRVMTKDGLISLFVNGTQVAKIKQVKPTGLMQAGVRVFNSQAKVPVNVEFSSFKVTDLP